MRQIPSYQGIDQFGSAYEFMFKNDAHAPNSVDREIVGSMLRLCSETVEHLYEGFTPTKSLYKRGSRPELERCLRMAVAGQRSNVGRIEGIAGFTSSLQEKADHDLDSMRFGGIEEEIIRRGSDLCGDVARVGCALFQVAGFPARIVILADTRKAYNAHVVVEVYRVRHWGAVDTLTNVVYRHPSGKPASTWDLMNEPRLFKRHRRGKATPYTTATQFRAAAIANYFVWRWRLYDYAVSSINDYYRSILEMSDNGWPGGQRWLHGEEKS